MDFIARLNRKHLIVAAIVIVGLLSLGAGMVYEWRQSGQATRLTPTTALVR
jgi:hypothetical protein